MPSQKLEPPTEDETEKAQAAEAEAARLRDGLRDLTNEINCRVEHGVGGVAALHLQYVENKLRALLDEDGAA